MPGYSAQGCTFTFNGLSYDVTSVSVEAPTAEIIDMTSIDAPLSERKLVPTGAASSRGRITVDCLGASNPQDLSGTLGEVRFETAQLGSIVTQAICESASVEASVGSLFRIRMTLTPTTYQG